VAEDGNDENAGTDRQKAWRTLGHAADRINQGDTVLVAEGTYRERVRIRATGEKNSPITFMSIPGQKVTLDGDGGSLDSCFVVTGKSHIRIDGLHFTNISDGSENKGIWWLLRQPGIFHLYRSSDIQITRCFNDGRHPGYAAGLVTAWEVDHLLIKNCVSLRSMGRVMIDNCPDFHLENSVFVRHLITAGTFSNGDDQKIYIKNNIFTDCMARKTTVAPFFQVDCPDSLVLNNNCFYLRVPPWEKTMFVFLRYKEERVIKVNIERFEKEIVPTDSIFASPDFIVMASLPRLPKDNDPKIVYPPDLLVDSGLQLDFQDFFVANPDLAERQIGLTPADFKDWYPQLR
jgi:hypothetical protein